MARAGLGPAWRCLFANDFDPLKARTYRANWGEDDLRVGDVWDLEAADLPGHADLAWASSPCQDFSLAGARAGLGGGRSSAFFGFWRLVEALDRQGRAALSPSLFDRDAYQAVLRQQSTNVSALRFDVLWKASKGPTEPLKLAVELRGTGSNGVPRLATLETNVVPGTFRQWTAIPLAGQAYRDFGQVLAWHVTLRNGSQVLGEQKSFLW